MEIGPIFYNLSRNGLTGYEPTSGLGKEEIDQLRPYIILFFTRPFAPHDRVDNLGGWHEKALHAFAFLCQCPFKFQVEIKECRYTLQQCRCDAYIGYVIWNIHTVYHDLFASYSKLYCLHKSPYNNTVPVYRTVFSWLSGGTCKHYNSLL
jgi:hypothetical protein